MFLLIRQRKRHVALEVQYDGTSYLGFASQDIDNTVENYLFAALEKSKLIENRKVNILLLVVITTVLC